MSTAQTRGGSWLSANYEKLALLVAFSLLLASAAVLYFLLQSKRQAIADAPWERAPANPATTEGVNTALVTSVTQSLTRPIQIPLERRRLAVGELRVACVNKGEPIAYDATNCPFCGAPQPPGVEGENRDSDGDKMLDKWEKKCGLNPLDPSDATGDLDADGFNNLDEFLAGSDPKDPASKPDSVTKLRMTNPTVEPFRLRFLGISKLPAGERYQLNVRTMDKTYFAKMGEVIEGFKVVEVDMKDSKKPTLVLQRGEKTLRLVQGEVVIDDSFSAFIVSLIDRRQFKVTKGASFKLQDSEYNVVDIKRDAVVIRDAKEGREITLLPLSEEERIKTRSDVATPEMMRRPDAVPGEGQFPIR